MRLASAAEGLRSGIAVIHQELQIVPELTVQKDLLLGRLPQRWGLVRPALATRQLSERLQQMGMQLELGARLRDLSTGQRQMVEICKALLRDAQVIALDEPTSSLSHREAEQLFRLVRALRAAGKVLTYVSHRMDEVFELADAATVLRDGRVVAEFASLQVLQRGALVQTMVGREIEDVYRWRPRALGPERLSRQRLPLPASLAPRRGEMLGLFGLVGAGRSELLRAIDGADPTLAGRVLLDGQALPPQRSGAMAAAIAAGLVFCPEDRKQDALLHGRSVAENINISCRRHGGWLGGFVTAPKAERQLAQQFIERLRIRCSGPAQEVQRLSGGKQQKVVLARWLAERGVSILMVSSELSEVLGLAFIVSGGQAVGIVRDDFFALGSEFWPGLPVPVWIMLAFVGLFALLLNRRVYGRNTLAIGGNPEAARLAGIPVARVRLTIFTVQGLVAAAAGLILASRISSGKPNAAHGFELNVISACVLGGVSLMGGRASISSSSAARRATEVLLATTTLPGTPDEARAGLKQRIGQRAAALVEPGDKLLVDAGTTTLQLARQLRGAQALTVMSNGLDILSAYNFDKLFLDVGGLDLGFGISTHREQEARLNRAMMARAHRTIVLTDSSKFGRIGLHRIGGLAQVHTLVTDAGIAAHDREALLRLGVELLVEEGEAAA
ncbi:ATP-binding cassette domain-containing protein [Paucibacter soli]|uniref:ATP-binding cassette domain-containing protein n=1 Tax=Paucibacter soli TaxID=3133433 RepID=UPI0030B53257